MLTLSPISRLIGRFPVLNDVLDEAYTIPRTGLIRRGVPPEEAESIGGHTAKLVYDGQLYPGGNKAERAVSAFCHDILVETGNGKDFTPHCGVSRREKERLERIWLSENLARIGPGAEEELRPVWEDYHHGRQPIVKQQDKIRAALEARVAELQGYENVNTSEFVANARPQVHDPFLKWAFSKWCENTPTSRTDPNEIYHEFLASPSDFELQRRLIYVVSRNPNVPKRGLRPGFAG